MIGEYTDDRYIRQLSGRSARAGSRVERYSQWFDYAVGVLLVLAIGGWVVKKPRKRRRAAAP
jgi:tRNA 2-selenouridine synthase SelU